MLKMIERYLDASRLVLSVAVVAALAAMLILNAAAVLSRTLGFGSIHWAPEISMLLAVGVYFLSYGIIVRRQAEIRVEFLADRLPHGVQNSLLVVGDLIQLCLYVFIGFLGIKYAIRISILPMPITQASQGFFFLPLIAGFLDSATVIVMRILVRREAEEGLGLSR